jgi:outer membrane receptor protein involved in Fe transport
MQKALLSLGFFFLSFGIAFSQGSIAGKITDETTGETIIGGTILVKGTSIGTSTDIDGNFLINSIASGTYTLQISYVGYKTHTIPDVIVETGKRITIDIKISSEASALEEVVITGSRSRDNDFSIVREIRESKLVVTGVSAEMISRTPDRDAAEVAKRVPGVTIMGGKYIVIRGLSERYNVTMLHGAYAPSMEADRRTFAFDIIPSAQLDQLLIFKSPSPELPGDFAGGVVKVTTKGIPEENNITVGYSLGYRSGSSLKDFYRGERSGSQLFGFNGGLNDLPASFPSYIDDALPAGQQENAAQSLRNNWTPEKVSSFLDQSASVTGSFKFNIKNIQVGNITALNWSNTWNRFDVKRKDFNQYDEINDTTDPIYAYTDDQNNQNTRTGLLFNWAFRFNDKHTIEFKNLYNQINNSQYISRQGPNYEANQYWNFGGFQETYRGVLASQLLGKHKLFNAKTNVNWVANLGKSFRDLPDNRRFRRNVDQSTGSERTFVPSVASPSFLGRFYGEMDEESIGGSLGIDHTFEIGENFLPVLSAGFFYEKKERTFDARNIGYVKSQNWDSNLEELSIHDLFNPANINNTTGLKLEEETNGSDSYSASNNLFAYYTGLTLPFGKKVTLSGGVRVENNKQSLQTEFETGDKVDQAPSVTRYLPSANLSYNFTENMLIRTTYGQTLNRPEFREIAPFGFYDFEYNWVYVGNPGLKTAKIQNYDIRWEWYPSKTEMVTVGGFYKTFDNAIEVKFEPGGGSQGAKTFTYQNANAADVYGVEIDVRKSLFGLTSSKFVDNLNILFNTAIIKSHVKVGNQPDRPLMGQSPYVINAGVYYNNDENGWQVAVLYNVVGKRLFAVGGYTDAGFSAYEDIYEMPRNVLDLSITKKIGERLTAKISISDILNQKYILMQDGNRDGDFDKKKDQIIQENRFGSLYTFGLTYKVWQK